MDDALKKFLNTVRNALFTEDFETLSRHCAVPLVVYSAAGVVTIKDRDEFKRMAHRFRQALSAFPITHGKCQILEYDPVVNNRFRATARWDEFGEDEALLTSSLVRYFLIVSSPDVWMIEMLEYLEMPVSLEDAEHILH